VSPEDRVVPGLLDEGLERERPQGRRVRIASRAWLRLFSAGGGLFLFVFALQIIKTGARAVVPLFENLDIVGPVNSLGFGWLAAYLALSG